MKIGLVRALPDQHETFEVDVPAGASIRDAISLAGWSLTEGAAVGVWGKVRPVDYLLREGDRIEVYRPLTADPKTARRKRALG